MATSAMWEEEDTWASSRLSSAEQQIAAVTAAAATAIATAEEGLLLGDDSLADPVVRPCTAATEDPSYATSIRNSSAAIAEAAADSLLLDDWRDDGPDPITAAEAAAAAETHPSDTDLSGSLLDREEPQQQQQALQERMLRMQLQSHAQPQQSQAAAPVCTCGGERASITLQRLSRNVEELKQAVTRSWEEEATEEATLFLPPVPLLMAARTVVQRGRLRLLLFKLLLSLQLTCSRSIQTWHSVSAMCSGCSANKGQRQGDVLTLADNRQQGEETLGKHGGAAQTWRA
ncbi:hypothetical protein cyc_06537 [Cyclospora cayetanensis]|uniref:Uncharacterized protein n=1 Tax=Cyclospora cayetanensis TaxID=88456 RepID=A0A1D3D4E2_9EIME|nr:hypothetical protein cyc_06537 [Cyclospora cayetanensis]